MISLSTNPRTVEMISCCTSVRPSVCARRPMVRPPFRKQWWSEAGCDPRRAIHESSHLVSSRPRQPACRVSASTGPLDGALRPELGNLVVAEIEHLAQHLVGVDPAPAGDDQEGDVVLDYCAA